MYKLNTLWLSFFFMTYYKRAYYSTPSFSFSESTKKSSLKDQNKLEPINPYKIAAEHLNKSENKDDDDVDVDGINSEFGEMKKSRNQEKEISRLRARIILFVCLLLMIVILTIVFFLLNKSARPDGLNQLLGSFDKYLESYHQDWFEGVMKRAQSSNLKKIENNSNENNNNSEKDNVNNININNNNSGNNEDEPEILRTLEPKFIEISESNLSRADQELYDKDQNFKEKLEKLKKEIEVKKEKEEENKRNSILKEKRDSNVETDLKFWNERIANTKKVISDLVLEKADKIKKLEEIKAKRLQLFNDNAEIDVSESESESDEENEIFNDGILKQINNMIKKEIDIIKGMEIKDRIKNVDVIMKEIYDWLFKEAICGSLLNDLVERKEIVEAVKHTVENTKLVKEVKNGESKMDKIWSEMQGLTASMTLLDKLLLEPVFGETISGTDYNKRNKDKTYQLFLNFRSRPIKFDRKVFDPEVHFRNHRLPVEALITGQYQRIERELFKLKLVDCDFHAQMSDVMVQVNGMNSFLREFDDLWTRTRELNTNSLLGKLDIHLNQQIKRKHLMKPQSTNDNDNDDTEVVLLEAWHKRNLLELFTADALVNYDELGEFEHLKSVEYSKRFHYWLQKVFVKTPIPKQSLAGMVFDWWIGGRDQEYRFSLKRAMVDYEVVIEGNCYKKDQKPRPLLVQDCLNADLGFTKIVEVNSSKPDAMLFSAMHFFSNIARLNSNDKEEIRYLWPTSLVEKPNVVTEVIGTIIGGDFSGISKMLDDSAEDIIDNTINVIGTTVDALIPGTKSLVNNLKSTSNIGNDKAKSIASANGSSTCSKVSNNSILNTTCLIANTSPVSATVKIGAAIINSLSKPDSEYGSPSDIY